MSRLVCTSLCRKSQRHVSSRRGPFDYGGPGVNCVDPFGSFQDVIINIIYTGQGKLGEMDASTFVNVWKAVQQCILAKICKYNPCWISVE